MTYKILSFLLFSLLFCNAMEAQTWQMKQAPLMTEFAKDVDPENVLPEYPRPQMERTEWMNLNGIWQFQPGIGQQEQLPTGILSSSILVPFAVESAISGVMKHHSRLWYRLNFVVPNNWDGNRILLHFGAVDYETEVYVNGESIGKHFGGYDPFSFDITDYLTQNETQELTVRVFDPTDAGGFPRGKQTLYPQGIMYTSVTGIWQSVWLEPVKETHIQALKLTPDIDESALKITVSTPIEANDLVVTVKIFDGNTVVARAEAIANKEFNVPISNQKLWSPDDPFLYDLEITLSKNNEMLDSVSSYFGMRKVSKEKDGDFQKLYLNNEFLFQMGPLDQGFWPDGLYTAPTDEALKYDIEMIKAFGYNMVRKHIKVEPQRWYYWADKLGVMVWQDMPSTNSYTSNPQPIDQVAYRKELVNMVENHWNSPSIVMWVIFNEGQGQHNTVDLVNTVKNLDPTRMVNQASGGEWHGAGHILDAHAYPAPVCPESSSQALVCGEYGGVGLKITGHIWPDGFGYVMAANEEELLKYYENYIDQLTVFKTNKGLSAAVYTEITDVEIELNGLLTYDRLPKADVTRLYNANRKVIEKDIYMWHLLPDSRMKPQSWQYTTSTPAQDWYLENFDDSGWRKANGGFGTMGTPGAVVSTIWNSSDIWLRQTFDLGDISSFEKENFVLTIHHDEDCDVYINGVWAATLTGWTTGYITAPISTSAFKALKPNSKNTIAINCKQTDGGQYIDAGISILSDHKITTAMQIWDFNNRSLNQIYPNPVEHTIHFSKALNTPSTVAVFNANGKLLRLEKNISDQINISNLIAGMYYLQVIEDKSVQYFNFLKI